MLKSSFPSLVPNPSSSASSSLSSCYPSLSPPSAAPPGPDMKDTFINVWKEGRKSLSNPINAELPSLCLPQICISLHVQLLLHSISFSVLTLYFLSSSLLLHHCGSETSSWHVWEKNCLESEQWGELQKWRKRVRAGGIEGRERKMI